jgi:hypothetical protein
VSTAAVLLVVAERYDKVPSSSMQREHSGVRQERRRSKKTSISHASSVNFKMRKEEKNSEGDGNEWEKQQKTADRSGSHYGKIGIGNNNSAGITGIRLFSPS